MADTKISALTAATTPLAGTEVLPIVQSGVTKQVSVANLTAGRAVSADSLSLTNALTAANGGTGQSSYAVGDLLYASTTTALSKLADVATGNALISGGVGVAPSWGKIGLTTHVSGTLPVGNGGTGTATAFTAGSVVFAGASGVYSQNNANFFWDNTNNRLGLGTTSPSRQLSVSGTTAYARLTDTDTAKSGSVEAALEFYASDGQKAVVGCPGNDDFLINVVDNVNLRFFTNNTERQRIFASGGVSIGNTTDPGSKNLSVSGNIYATGSGLIGYGTGSGGTVTQLTSKATAVTLNKATGQITTSNAALAAGASVIFLVNNDKIASIDTAVVSVQYSTGQSYSVDACAMGDGYMYVRLTNVTGGSLSDAVTINFSVIKGAIS